MAEQFIRSKNADILRGCRANALYIRGVQKRLNRPGFRQAEIDLDEECERDLLAYMKKTGKRPTSCFPGWDEVRRVLAQ